MPTLDTSLGPAAAVSFPGRIIAVGEQDMNIVRAVQKRLNAVGCGPVPEDGVFDKSHTLPAVKLFQARFTDVTSRPLVVDGKIGTVTWGAMFGAATVASVTVAPSRLTKAAVDFAGTQVGVIEHPLGSNRGPEVDEYLRAVGLDPASDSFAWCVAFTHFCYLKAAQKIGIGNPHIKTAGVLDHWNKAKTKPNVRRILHDQAVADPTLITPGCLFIIDTGGGHGHSGMVLEVANGRLLTIEGNTNDQGSRNGIGVFRRDARKVATINKGFIDYSAF